MKISLTDFLIFQIIIEIFVDYTTNISGTIILAIKVQLIKNTKFIVDNT
jgi:hypothetical protein